MKKRIFIATIVVLLIAWGPTSATKISKEDSEATHILIGKVADIESYFGLNEWGDQLIFSRINVKVEKKIKGELGDFVEFLIEGGSVGDMALYVSESAAFEKGETAKLYLKKVGPDFKLLKKEEVVVSQAGPQVLKGPKSTLPCCVTFAHWPTNSAPYYINSAQNDVSVKCALADIQAGAGEWSPVFNLAYQATTPINYAAADNTNVVFFRPGSSGSTIAVTYIWYSKRTKIITDFDTAFYVDAWAFFSYGCGQTCTGGFYIQPIAAHELGHAIGLDHNKCVTSLMYPYANYCETNTPSADDLACASNLYK